MKEAQWMYLNERSSLYYVCISMDVAQWMNPNECSSKLNGCTQTDGTHLVSSVEVAQCQWV